MQSLSPDQYDVVQSVFKALVQSAWFDRNAANEKACAKFVLLQYGDGGLMAAELLAKCEEAAQERFARRH